jgi:hypothetical protein
MQRIVADCSTGEVERVAMTQEEEAAHVAMQSGDGAQAWLWSMLRTRRNALLAGCDYTQVPDAPTWVDRAAWAAYRQQLRDLPASTTDPTNPVWPAEPQPLAL